MELYFCSLNAGIRKKRKGNMEVGRDERKEQKGKGGKNTKVRKDRNGEGEKEKGREEK